ncbi:MAG: hypothetical protein LBC45_00070 [Chlamydiales bacterium]|nr:hypothetical protein [Chlamydiales bacterium]
MPPVHDLPPWNIAYTQFVIWQKRGEFEMQEFLGRKAQARGAIIDSQSVKTEEKGSSVDMTVGRKSKAEKGIKITNIFQIQAKQ